MFETTFNITTNSFSTAVTCNLCIFLKSFYGSNNIISIITIIRH